MENIFLADKKADFIREYLQYAQNSRGNLGDELPVMVYRMLEYSMKDELIRRFGKETQIDIFPSGREEGRRVLCEAKFLDISLPLDQLAGSQRKLQELKIGLCAAKT